MEILWVWNRNPIAKWNPKLTLLFLLFLINHFFKKKRGGEKEWTSKQKEKKYRNIISVSEHKNCQDCTVMAQYIDEKLTIKINFI